LSQAITVFKRLRAMSRVWWIFAFCVVAWVIGSGLYEVFAGAALGSAYWLGAVFAMILAGAGLRLAYEQGDLQVRLADLELREKMTCFDANRFHLNRATAEAAWAFNIIGDARSALPLYTSATEEVQKEFAALLGDALANVKDCLEGMSPKTQADLRDRALQLQVALEHTALERAALQKKRSTALFKVAAGMDWVAPAGMSEPRLPPRSDEPREYALTARDFAAFFEPSTRVLIDWLRVQRSDWPVDVEVAGLADITRWYFPWHVGADGDETRFDDPHARPLRVGDWAPPTFSGHRDAVNAIAHELRHRPSPVQFVVATYGLPGDTRLVIDGNHRLAAVIQEQLPVRCLAVTLHGPADERLLPDLRYWSAPQRTGDIDTDRGLDGTP
jgi:hypothetical protein